MRCVACNKILSSQESTRRFKESASFVDLCNECLETISDDVEVTEGYQEDDDEEFDDEDC